MTSTVARSTVITPKQGTPPRLPALGRAFRPGKTQWPAPAPVNPTISIGLIGGQRLMREATANLIADQDGLELLCTFDSTTDYLAVDRRSHPQLLLVDCDRDSEPWLDALTALECAHGTSLIVMLCHEISGDIANYAINHGVSGVILKSYTASEIRDSIAYMNSGRTVLPAGWQEAAATDSRGCLQLSPRHRQVLAMIAQGASNEEIANTLNLSPNTVKFHVRALYARLGVRNRVEAAGCHARMTDEPL